MQMYRVLKINASRETERSWPTAALLAATDPAWLVFSFPPLHLLARYKGPNRKKIHTSKTSENPIATLGNKDLPFFAFYYLCILKQTNEVYSSSTDRRKEDTNTYTTPYRFSRPHVLTLVTLARLGSGTEPTVCLSSTLFMLSLYRACNVLKQQRRTAEQWPNMVVLGLV